MNEELKKKQADARLQISRCLLDLAQARRDHSEAMEQVRAADSVACGHRNRANEAARELREALLLLVEGDEGLLRLILNP